MEVWPIGLHDISSSVMLYLLTSDLPTTMQHTTFSHFGRDSISWKRASGTQHTTSNHCLSKAKHCVGQNIFICGVGLPVCVRAHVFSTAEYLEYHNTSNHGLRHLHHNSTLLYFPTLSYSRGARPSISSSLQITKRSFRYDLWNQPLLHSIDLILFTLFLVHLILRISPHHCLNLRSDWNEQRTINQSINQSICDIDGYPVFEHGGCYFWDQW